MPSLLRLLAALIVPLALGPLQLRAQVPQSPIVAVAPDSPLLVWGDMLWTKERQFEHLPGSVVASKTSPSDRVVALLVARPEEQRTFHLVLLEADGQVRFTRPVPYAPDDPVPVLAVSDAGAVALGDPATTRVTLLAPDGTLTGETVLVEDAPYAVERTLLVRFAADGQTLAAATQRTPARPGHPEAARNTKLAVLDLSGAVRWQQTLPEQALYALGAPGDAFAVATYDAYADDQLLQQSRFFDARGQVELAAPLLFREVQEAPGGVRWLADVRTMRALGPDGAEIFRYDAGQVGAVLDLDAPRGVLLVGVPVPGPDQSTVYANLRAVALDAAGQVTAEKSLTMTSTRPRFARPTDGKLYVVLDDAMAPLPFTPRPDTP